MSGLKGDPLAGLAEEIRLSSDVFGDGVASEHEARAVARSVYNSEWLAAYETEVRQEAAAEALREAADVADLSPRDPECPDLAGPYLVSRWLRERADQIDGPEHCDCTELCSMGPTCPGASPDLPGAGCWRAKINDEGGRPMTPDDLDLDALAAVAESFPKATSWSPSNIGPDVVLALIARVREAKAERDDLAAKVERVEALAASNGASKGESHVRLTRHDPRLGCEVTESFVRVADLRAALDGDS